MKNGTRIERRMMSFADLKRIEEVELEQTPSLFRPSRQCSNPSTLARRFAPMRSHCSLAHPHLLARTLLEPMSIAWKGSGTEPHHSCCTVNTRRTNLHTHTSAPTSRTEARTYDRVEEASARSEGVRRFGPLSPCRPLGKVSTCETVSR
jgi:hypothetical protein